ncbi:methyltransferase domain-containing protein [Magnetovirga frankeli]|uniref:class I SAM-dependent methyltransferase n=1 Tax=Magnetovirga frankeli TaxID=947516 RepID=UPI00129332D0|nr:methyltransferase domain-containing protein [gamma proteobacterium SS-5]
MSERQTGKRLQDIRADHIERYRFALNAELGGARILDIACGIGYGSFLLAENSGASEIVAVDRSGDALVMAKTYYDHPAIRWVESDAYRVGEVITGQFDVVCSFETLEHLPRDADFLRLIARMMKPGGLLYVSTPNEDVMGFDHESFPYHVRHYTSNEFRQLLESTGFSLVGGGSQLVDEVQPCWGGRFNIALCRKDQSGDSMIPTIRPLGEIVRDTPLSADLLNALGTAHILRMLEEGVFAWDSLMPVMQLWASAGSEAACYLLALRAEEMGAIEEARAYLQQRLALVSPGEQGHLSALFHLGRLSRGADRKHWLERCLYYEPDHRAARALLQLNGADSPVS